MASILGQLRRDFQNGKFRDTVILGSKRSFKKYGQSGIEVSDLFPHTSQCVDDLAIIRSCYHEGFTHSQAQFLINNGWPRIGRPSLGSWILYGLGTENQNLPGFVVLLEGGVRSDPLCTDRASAGCVQGLRSAPAAIRSSI
jgi:hypothetical protein